MEERKEAPKYTVGTFRAVGLEAKWGKTGKGKPVLFARDPKRTDCRTWWLIDRGVWDQIKKYGVVEGFNNSTLLGDLFSLPVKTFIEPEQKTPHMEDPAVFLGSAVWRKGRKVWACKGRDKLDGNGCPEGHTPIIRIGEHHLEWCDAALPFSSNPHRYCLACANAAIRDANEAEKNKGE